MLSLQMAALEEWLVRSQPLLVAHGMLAVFSWFYLPEVQPGRFALLKQMANEHSKKKIRSQLRTTIWLFAETIKRLQMSWQISSNSISGSNFHIHKSSSKRWRFFYNKKDPVGSYDICKPT